MIDDFAAKLGELRRAYIATLPIKLDEIAAAVTRRALEDTRALAHRLRGTAGSYGVASISEAVGAIEDRIDGAATGGESPSLWKELEALLASARKAVAELT